MYHHFTFRTIYRDSNSCGPLYSVMLLAGYKDWFKSAFSEVWVLTIHKKKQNFHKLRSLWICKYYRYLSVFSIFKQILSPFNGDKGIPAMTYNKVWRKSTELSGPLIPANIVFWQFDLWKSWTFKRPNLITKIRLLLRVFPILTLLKSRLKGPIFHLS